METAEAIGNAAEWIATTEHVVVFTGAGVSTESGIPDFRSPGGLWERYDPRDFTYQRFLSSEDARVKYWEMHSELYRMLTQVAPNPSHYACVELDKLGKLDCVITQNIDNLHQDAGLAAEKLIELHGNALVVSCLSCGTKYTREDVQRRLDAGEIVPPCMECGGILKPDTVSFGQSMPLEEMRRAEYHSEHCDLFIVVGSSLLVHPAALMPVLATSRGAKLIIINLTETPYDGDAGIVIRHRAGEVMSAIVQKVKETLAA
jgi:NAD-dependent deacetylase